MARALAKLKDLEATDVELDKMDEFHEHSGMGFGFGGGHSYGIGVGWGDGIGACEGNGFEVGHGG